MVEHNVKTQKEAVNMYCGMGKGANGNRHCHGEYCMMWRWVSNEKGYCGLAGRPVV